MADTLRENIRIDKGIKRPKYPHKPVSPKGDLGSWKIPPELDPDEVLAEYLAAATTSAIAGRYGLSRKALTGWLRQIRPEGWKHVQVLRALNQKEDGNEQLEVAPDALSLARARELVKSAQWDLERLDSSTFGQKQEVTVQVDHNHEISKALEDKISDLLLKVRGEQPAIDVTPEKLPEEGGV